MVERVQNAQGDIQRLKQQLQEAKGVFRERHDLIKVRGWATMPVAFRCDLASYRGSGFHDFGHILSAADLTALLPPPLPPIHRGTPCAEPVSRGWPNYFAEMRSGSEEGSYLRLIDFCITQL